MKTWLFDAIFGGFMGKTCKALIVLPHGWCVLITLMGHLLLILKDEWIGSREIGPLEAFYYRLEVFWT